MACWNFPYNKIELHYSWTRFLSTWSFHCRPCLLAGISFSDNPTGLGSISPRFSGLYPSTRGFHRHKKCQTHPFDVPHTPHKLTQLLEKCKSSTSIHGDRVIGLVVRWSKHLNPNTYLYNLSSTMSFFYLKGLWLIIYLHCIIIHIYIYIQSYIINLLTSLWVMLKCMPVARLLITTNLQYSAGIKPKRTPGTSGTLTAVGLRWVNLVGFISFNPIVSYYIPNWLVMYIYIYYNGGLPPNHPF